MNFYVKKSTKPVNYVKAIDFLEKTVVKINQNNSRELIWILEHPSTFTAGSRSLNNEILDKNIKIIKTNRGGKITWHGPGQLICYFAIDLNKRKKDIRKFLGIIEKTLIKTLKEYKINSFNDRKNIGIWVKHENKVKKIAAIGIKIKKWIAYHGFAINISNSLDPYEKILPCGIKNNKVTNLMEISNQNYNKLGERIVENFTKNLEI